MLSQQIDLMLEKLLAVRQHSSGSKWERDEDIPNPRRGVLLIIGILTLMFGGIYAMARLLALVLD